jgi:hypothetical protein
MKSLQIFTGEHGLVLAADAWPSPAAVERTLLIEACRRADSPSAVASALGITAAQLRKLAKQHRVTVPGEGARR